MKTILRFFFKPKGQFEISKRGFERAKFWCKIHQHPNNKKETLYEYLYSLNLDGWENIHIINKYKKENFNY